MIKVVSEEEAEEAAFVACIKVKNLVPLEDMKPGWREFATMVRARSRQQPCCSCGELVIVDSKSPQKPPKICMECLTDTQKAD